MKRGAIAIVIFLFVTACSDGGGGSAIREIPGPDRGARGELRFADVAADVGLDFTHGAFRWDVTADPVATMGSGLCWIDYDEDGWLDLYVVNSWAERERARWLDTGGLPKSALYRNVRGRFEDVSAESRADLAVRGGGCLAADLDNDGHTDLFVTTDSNAALLWNEGDGTFTEGAQAAGAAAPGWLAGAAAGDVNGDGWPELFLAGYVDLNGEIAEATQGFPNTNLGVRDRLYLNEGRARGGHAQFREVGADAGLEVVAFEYGLGAQFRDFDADGDLDVYVANDTKPNRLYSNVAWPGGVAADPLRLGIRFEELAGRAGVADPNAGMGVAADDFDGDGRTDLFVTNARGQQHALFRSQPPEAFDPSFIAAAPDAGVDLSDSTGWGASFADLDLDTDLDLVFVNGAVPVRDRDADAEPVRVLVNLTAQEQVGKFDDLGPNGGLAAVGPILARGSAAADYDNDGDVDVAVNVVGGPLVLLENRTAGGRWLEVALEPFRPGTVVTATLADGQVLMREAVAGSSYLSTEDPRLHFGLGDTPEVAELLVRWPDSRETSIEDVAADRVVVVRDR